MEASRSPPPWYDRSIRVSGGEKPVLPLSASEVASSDADRESTTHAVRARQIGPRPNRSESLELSADCPANPRLATLAYTGFPIAECSVPSGPEWKSRRCKPSSGRARPRVEPWQGPREKSNGNPGSLHSFVLSNHASVSYRRQRLLRRDAIIAAPINSINRARKAFRVSFHLSRKLARLAGRGQCSA